MLILLKPPQDPTEYDTVPSDDGSDQREDESQPSSDIEELIEVDLSYSSASSRNFQL